MNIKDSKVKRFVKKYQEPIKAVSILIGAVVIGSYIHRDGYVKGANAGVKIGFGGAIEWCDEKFEHIRLTERVNAWAEENPEKWEGPLLKEKA